MAMLVSCGVIVTDGTRFLLGHATRTPRWDIPKGLAEQGERHDMAAVRELQEETSLQVAVQALQPLGMHQYLRGKALALFAWRPPVLPDPAMLVCSSMVERPGMAAMPEIDRFGIFAFDAGMALVGKNLARVLTAVWPLLV